MKLKHQARRALRKLTLPAAVALAVADVFQAADVIQTILGRVAFSL